MGSSGEWGGYDETPLHWLAAQHVPGLQVIQIGKRNLRPHYMIDLTGYARVCREQRYLLWVSIMRTLNADIKISIHLLVPVEGDAGS